LAPVHLIGVWGLGHLPSIRLAKIFYSFILAVWSKVDSFTTVHV